MANEFVNQLRQMANMANETAVKVDKSTKGDYIDEIDHVITKAAQRGEYFYTYNGVDEKMVMELAIFYDALGFVTSVRKDRYGGSWSLYLNWV